MKELRGVGRVGGGIVLDIRAPVLRSSGRQSGVAQEIHEGRHEIVTLLPVQPQHSLASNRCEGAQ